MIAGPPITFRTELTETGVAAVKSPVVSGTAGIGPVGVPGDPGVPGVFETTELPPPLITIKPPPAGETKPSLRPMTVMLVAGTGVGGIERY